VGPFLGVATYCRELLGPQLEEARSLGFDHVEVDLTGPPTLDPGILQTLREPSLPPRTAHVAEVVRPEDLARAVALVDSFTPLGVRVFNVHLPGHAGLGPSGPQVDLLSKLVEEAGAQGASVTVENAWEDPEAMTTVLSQVEGLGFCLDLGHANLFTTQYRGPAFLRTLGSRLRLVHVSDNLGGEKDLHLPMGQGSVPLTQVLSLLTSQGYTGPITLEIFRGGREGRAGSLARVRTASGVVGV
jgi:sugar phosphate isomerase/epimerase